MFRFTPQTIPSNIFVIGGGGTGSRLMPMLTQFMRSITRGVSPTGWVEKPTIWVVDDDTVEQKNLLRQNFIQNDVGKPKAAVLAERYGRAYDVDVIPIVTRVDGSGGFHNAVNEILNAKQSVAAAPVARNSTSLTTVLQSSIVIICVDSAEARRSILNNFMLSRKSSGAPGSFFIDAGNEDAFGQVNFFTPTIPYGSAAYDKMPESAKLPKLIGSVCDIDFLPMNVEYYRNLEDTPAQGSCADLNQTLAINAMMATTIMGIVQNYYYRKTFTYNCIRLSLDGGNATEYNTFNNFKRLAVIDDNAVNKWVDNNVNATVGSKMRLTFARGLDYMSVSNLYALLKQKIDSDEEEAAAQRRKEAMELKKAEQAAAREAAKAKLGKLGVNPDTTFTVQPLPEGKHARPGSAKIKVVPLVKAESAESAAAEYFPTTPLSAALPPVQVDVDATVRVETAAPARRRRNVRETVLAQPPEEVAVPETWTGPQVDLMARAVESVQALPRNRRT